MANTRGTAMTIPQEFAEKIKRASYKDKIMSIAPILVLVAMILVFSLILGFNVFLAPTNIAAILKQLAIPLCVALGLTFVIMIGSIDLSIDGAVGLSGSLAGVFVANEVFNFDLGLFGVALAILAVVLVGLPHRRGACVSARAFPSWPRSLSCISVRASGASPTIPASCRSPTR